MTILINLFFRGFFAFCGLKHDAFKSEQLEAKQRQMQKRMSMSKMSEDSHLEIGTKVCEEM